jgi:hypothetical protein
MVVGKHHVQIRRRDIDAPMLEALALRGPAHSERRRAFEYIDEQRAFGVGLVLTDKYRRRKIHG